MEKLTMTVHEMATVLGISNPTAYALAHSEGFPTLRQGRKLLISKQGLLQWLAKQTGTTESDDSN